MELPKNITQIGESDQRCKIYVEDYVISYMKQLNQPAQNKDMAVAVYGVRREEKEVSYLFLYGACKLTFLQKETRHLSQAQLQEIEKFRRKYFNEYAFLGYRLLNGEMIEGFHVCEQGICRYISGYAQFYEKNDGMLAYMLDAREEVAPEEVDQQKYETIKKRQEERKLSGMESKRAKPEAERSTNGIRGMRVAVVAVFALLCMIGLTSLNGSNTIEDLQAVARQAMSNAGSQIIPDKDTLVAEDKLTEAIQQENEGASLETEEAIAEVPEVSEAVEVISEATQASEAAEATAEVPETVEATEPIVEAPDVEPSQETIQIEETVQPASYIIAEGDTLIGISVRNYGSDTMVSEICLLNQITNPDNIQVGQKILLP